MTYVNITRCAVSNELNVTLDAFDDQQNVRNWLNKNSNFSSFKTKRIATQSKLKLF